MEKESEFFEGNRNKCKACRRIELNANHRKRCQDPKYSKKMSEKSLLWARKNKDKVKETKAIYRKTHTQGKVNPFKNRARVALRNAVHSGKISKPNQCEKCGWIGTLDGHHEDYNKPLEVVWLCRICHGREHRKYRD